MSKLKREHLAGLVLAFDESMNVTGSIPMQRHLKDLISQARAAHEQEAERIVWADPEMKYSVNTSFDSGFIEGRDESKRLNAHKISEYESAAARAYAAELRLGKAIKALKFYADGDHLMLADPDAWDTCSGEPQNFLHDEAGTASVEDGSIAKAALDALLSASAEPANGDDGEVGNG